jgi:hypothetical protein
MTTKSAQEVQEYLDKNCYGVRIYPAVQDGEDGFRVDILANYGWPYEHVIDWAFIGWNGLPEYPFGTDQALYVLLDRFNRHTTNLTEEEEAEYYAASGSFYRNDDEVPNSWYNDVVPVSSLGVPDSLGRV